MLMYRVTQQGRRGLEQTIALFGSPIAAEEYRDFIAEQEPTDYWPGYWTYRVDPTPFDVTATRTTD